MFWIQLSVTKVFVVNGGLGHLILCVTQWLIWGINRIMGSFNCKAQKQQQSNMILQVSAKKVSQITKLLRTGTIGPSIETTTSTCAFLY